MGGAWASVSLKLPLERPVHTQSRRPGPHPPTPQLVSWAPLPSFWPWLSDTGLGPSAQATCKVHCCPPPTPLGAATQAQSSKQKSPGGPERWCEQGDGGRWLRQTESKQLEGWQATFYSPLIQIPFKPSLGVLLRKINVLFKKPCRPAPHALPTLPERT